MSIINIKCKHCDNNISFDSASKNVTCEFCGSTYSIQELLDENDISFIEKLKPKQIENKIETASHIKSGEALIYQAEYARAEAEFKKALEIDKTNARAYFGVVKAKTHNLTIIPTFDGYVSYAKDALKYAEEDDKEHIKAELAKLKLLEKENEKQKKLKQQRQAQEKKIQRKKTKRLDLFSKILYILIFIITGIALVAVIAKSYTDELKKSEANATIEISTSSELLNFMNKKEYLSATIILKNDIDMKNADWTPVGNATSPFTGSFHGGGHTISNLKISNPNYVGENYLGLFGYAKDATITGIKLDGVIIEVSEEVSPLATIIENEATNIGHAEFATLYAGLIVARANDSSIKLCEVLNTSKITITNKTDANLILGGIVGYAKNSEINHCASHAEIIGSAADAMLVSSTDSLDFAAGGIVAKLENSGVSYSYSSADISLSVSATDNPDTIRIFVGGVIGFSTSTHSLNFYAKYCFFTGSIFAEANTDFKEEKIGGIIASADKLENISNNQAIFENDKFILGNISLETTDLYDSSLITFPETEEELIEFISSNFSSDVWENTNSKFPSIKAA